MSTTTLKEKFSKILVAVDVSEPSMAAADDAILMARLFHANLIAVYVLPENIRYQYEDRINSDVPVTPSVSEIIELPRQEIEEKSFSKIKEICKENNVKLNTEVISTTKSIAAELVDYAESNNVDLIVVGTRGRSGFKKMLLGSIAAHVITYAYCPVLVVK